MPTQSRSTQSRSPQSRSTRQRPAGRRAAATLAAAGSALAVTATAFAALPSGGQPSAGPAVTRIGPLPAGASVTRGERPAGQVLAGIEARQRVKAAAAAREARARDAAATRSASRTVDYRGDARGIARSLMAEQYGWGAGEFSCLSSLWERESGWDRHAANPSSGAYGIPQALPGSKMAAYGGDWRDNPVTQIRWGLAYIEESYGTPCGAWSAFRSQGWY